MLHTKFSIEKLDSIADKMDKAPPAIVQKQEFNKQEAVRYLYKKIKKMHKAGYTIEQISKLLNEQGFNISLPTFKAYVQKAKPVAEVVKKQ